MRLCCVFVERNRRLATEDRNQILAPHGAGGDHPAVQTIHAKHDVLLTRNRRCSSVHGIHAHSPILAPRHAELLLAHVEDAVAHVLAHRVTALGVTSPTHRNREGFLHSVVLQTPQVHVRVCQGQEHVVVVGRVAAGQSRVNAEGKANMGVFWSEERSDCTQLPVSQSQMRLERECVQRVRPVAIDGGGEEP